MHNIQKVKIKGGQKTDEGVKISKCNIKPNVQEIGDLQTSTFKIVLIHRFNLFFAIKVILYLLKLTAE